MDATNNLGVVKDRNVVNPVNDIDSNKKNSPIHHIDNDLNDDRNRNIDNNLEYLRPEQADQYRYTQRTPYITLNTRYYNYLYYL